MLKGSVPRLVKLNCLGTLEVPTLTLPKCNALTDAVTQVALPVRLRTCGLPPSLSVTVTAPYLTPGTVGRNLRVRVQLAPAARLEVQVVVRR